MPQYLAGEIIWKTLDCRGFGNEREYSVFEYEAKTCERGSRAGHSARRMARPSRCQGMVTTMVMLNKTHPVTAKAS
jgi:hypothetical protein